MTEAHEAAAWVQLVRELGLPTIVGVALGALASHYLAKAQHKRAMELVVYQDERRAAGAALTAVREMRQNAELAERATYMPLHNEWASRVLSNSRLIRSDQLDRRAQASAYVIFLATLARDAYVEYALLRAFLDVEDWLEAWLRQEKPPEAQLPSVDETRSLVLRDGRVQFEALTEWLQKRA
jgi:hypothetical protein